MSKLTKKKISTVSEADEKSRSVVPRDSLRPEVDDESFCQTRSGKVTSLQSKTQLIKILNSHQLASSQSKNYASSRTEKGKIHVLGMQKDPRRMQ